MPKACLSSHDWGKWEKADSNSYIKTCRRCGVVVRRSGWEFEISGEDAKEVETVSLSLANTLSTIDEQIGTNPDNLFMKIKILFLAANPENTSRLRLDEEVREIKEGLRRSTYRDQFHTDSKWAIRLRDLRRAILDHQPHIVHFCGHGEKDGLMVEDDYGKAVLVKPSALAGLFELFAHQIKCVVLNACYSQPQVEAISKHIPYVIGMKEGFEDKAAIEFAVGFYDALGAGESIEKAFKFGCNAIQLYDIPQELTPILRKNPEKIKKTLSSFGQPFNTSLPVFAASRVKLHMIIQKLHTFPLIVYIVLGVSIFLGIGFFTDLLDSIIQFPYKYRSSNAVSKREGHTQRIISNDIADILIKNLSACPPMNVKIKTIPGDQESWNLALQIHKIFSDAGWKVYDVELGYLTPPKSFYIQFSEKPPNIISETLIPLFDELGYGRKANINSKIPKNTIEIIIGER